MLNLTGRGAIVAGTRRLGAQLVHRLADEGINLAVVYRNSKAEAEELVESVRPRVGQAFAIHADLSLEENVESAVAQARRELGDLSFCLNLASDYPRTPLDSLDGAAWDRGIAAAKANYLLSVHASRIMRANAGPTRGHLIYFGDWAALETPYTDFLPYLTAKAAIVFMARAFALELAPFGILVNAISPGPTARDPSWVSSDEWVAALAETPLHRESSFEEMAELIVTLLKLETMTGENLRVDSGRHVSGSGLPKPAV